MAGLLDRVKLIADIAQVSSEIYGLLVDKSRMIAGRDAKIAALEAEIARLKARL